MGRPTTCWRMADAPLADNRTVPALVNRVGGVSAAPPARPRWRRPGATAPIGTGGGSPSRAGSRAKSSRSSSSVLVLRRAAAGWKSG